MNDELFNELMESVREGGAILRGEIAPSRRRNIPQTPKIPSLVFLIIGALSMLLLVILARFMHNR